MKPSNRCTAIIKEFEGLRLEAYICPAGKPTIGWGHTRGVKIGDKITREEAERLLDEDIVLFADEVRSVVTQPLNQSQLDSIVSFVFNIGLKQFLTSTIRRKINVDPNDPSIADELARWIYSGGKVLEGLIRRRAAESALYFSN